MANESSYRAADEKQKSAIDLDGVAEESKEIGGAFLTFRSVLNLNQSQFGELIGVRRRQLVAQIEAGTIKIPFSVLYRAIVLCDYLIENEKQYNLSYIQLGSIKLIKTQLDVYLKGSQEVNPECINRFLSPNS